MFAEYWLYMVVPLIFVAVIFWIYRPSAKKRYEADGDIPFEEDRQRSKAGPRGQG